MLRKISISNYKMFDNFELELTDGVNLICGSNGSGKSALREVLYALVKFLAMPDVSEHIAIQVGKAFPFDVFCRWKVQPEGSGDINIGIELDDEYAANGKFSYDLLVRYNFKERICRVQAESLKYLSNEGLSEIITVNSGQIEMKTDDYKPLSFGCDWSLSGLGPGSRNNSRIRKFGQLVAHIISIHLAPFAMEQDFSPAPPVMQLGKMGENFPAWRYNYSSEYPEKQNEVMQVCKSVIPGLVSLADRRLGDDRRLGVRVNYDGKDYELSFDELSDGQKKLIAMYSLLANVSKGTTILIDEPENYLAPSELQPWLDAMHDAWEDHNIQFLIISHNPKTLNWHHKEAIIFEVTGMPPRIVCYRNDGETPLMEKLNEVGWIES